MASILLCPLLLTMVGIDCAGLMQEYPSINRYIEPIKMSQTDESEDGCIMNYCYKWTVSDDYSSIAEVEIDQDGNEKGEMYRRTWTRMDGVDVGAAIERVKTYMQK